MSSNHARPVPPADPDFDALFALAATPLVEVDRDGTVWRANGAACRLLHVGPRAARESTLAALLGVDPADLRLEDSPSEVRAHVGGTELLLGVQAVRRTLRSPTGPLCVVQLVRRARTATQIDADRRAAVERSSLLDDVSHNLGTPLAIISGYAQMLSERPTPLTPAEVKRATDAIARQSGRAVEQLQALQARARVSVGGAGAIESAGLLGWLRRMLADPLAAHGTVLTAELGPSIIHVDVTTVRQMMLNIGHVLLRGEPAPTTIHLRVGAVDGGTELAFRSDGGVAAGSDTIAHTAELAERIGGRYVPPTVDAPVHAVWVPTSSDDVLDTTPTISVALIEDDPDTAALIRASLSHSASMFELVVEERSLERGVAAVERAKPRILLLDQQLPDGVGTDRLEDLHRASPGMTVVVLSAHAPTPAQSTQAVWLEKGRVLADLGRQLIEVLATRPEV